MIVKPESLIKYNLIKETKLNLIELAEELALNQFDNATIDICPNQRETVHSDKDGVSDLKKVVLDFDRIDLKSRDSNPRRNILVLGAGATSAAFDSIPLARTAISSIQEKIEVVPAQFDVDKNETAPSISFDYFIKYYQKKNKDLPKIISLDNFEEDTKKDKILNALLPKKEESKKGKIHYLRSLGQKYFNEYKKLKLYTIDDYSTNNIDFETSLNILAKLFDISTIRVLIQELYDFKHGSILFYQIVAHLFKNGFIDVIINFNFDEFLDQSINDELGKESYDYIVSDGDCKLINELDLKGKLRQPLYIKPHGTASHKSSLRFTKDHYNDLPTDMRRFIEEVISGKTKKDEEEEKVKRINLITVGFAMGSLEFNEILKNNLPDKSKIFSFYYHHDNKSLVTSVENRKTIFNKIWDNDIKKNKNEVFEKGSKNYKLKLLGHEFFKESIEHFYKPDNIENKNNEEDKSKKEDYVPDDCLTPLDNTFKTLYEIIQKKFTSPFKPSNICHHLILSNIFGNKKSWSAFRKDSEKKDFKSSYPETYFESGNYFKDRVIIESLIHTVRNNGCLDLPVMMKGVIGYYYNLYYDSFKKSDESKSPPAIIEILNGVFDISIGEKEEISLFKINYLEDIEKLEYIMNIALLKNKELSDSLNRYLEWLHENGHFKKYIFEHFEKIKNSNSSRIRSKLRSSIHHVFQEYSQTDLISSNLHLDMLFYKDVISKKSNANSFHLIADYGHQFSKFSKEILDKSSIVEFSFIFHWDINKNKGFSEEDLDKEKDRTIKRLFNFNGEKIKIKGKEVSFMEFKNRYSVCVYFLPIQEHHHHMRIIKDASGTLLNAIYYYKNGLSINVNPIQITMEKNLKDLEKVFDNYIKEKAINFEIKLKEKLEKSN